MFKQNKKMLALLALALAVPNIYADTEEKKDKNEKKFGFKSFAAGAVGGSSVVAGTLVHTYNKAIKETSNEIISNLTPVLTEIQNHMPTNTSYTLPSLEDVSLAIAPSNVFEKNLAKSYIGQVINKMGGLMDSSVKKLEGVPIIYLCGGTAVLYVAHRTGIINYFFGSNSDNDNNDEN